MTLRRFITDNAWPIVASMRRTTSMPTPSGTNAAAIQIGHAMPPASTSFAAKACHARAALAHMTSANMTSAHA